MNTDISFRTFTACSEVTRLGLVLLDLTVTPGLSYNITSALLVLGGVCDCGQCGGGTYWVHVSLRTVLMHSTYVMTNVNPQYKPLSTIH